MKVYQRLIANLFGIPLPEPPKDPIRHDTREPFKLTLDDWRKQEQLVLESRALARNLTYRAQMDVLRNSHPVHTVFSPVGVNPNDRIVHNAKCEGYEICLNNLEAMAKPYKQLKPLEATFADPEEQTINARRK